MSNLPLHGRATGVPMPTQYLDDYEAWDGYMGEVWRSVLSPLMQQHGSEQFVEVAPGGSAKIGRALAALGFTGTLWLVDPTPVMMQRTVARYAQLLPGATIRSVVATLTDSIHYIPASVGIVASNHPLDDMLLCCGLETHERDALFEWREPYSSAISPGLAARWARMAGTPPRIRQAQDSVEAEWRRCFMHWKGSGVAISQYASAALAQPNLAGLNEAAKVLLPRLRQAVIPADQELVQSWLNQHPHHDNAYIGHEVLDGHHWLVGQT